MHGNWGRRCTGFFAWVIAWPETRPNRSLLHINHHYHQRCENVSHKGDNVHLIVDTYPFNSPLVSLDCTSVISSLAGAGATKCLRLKATRTWLQRPQYTLHAHLTMNDQAGGA
jgi:hypothetical protein